LYVGLQGRPIRKGDGEKQEASSMRSGALSKSGMDCRISSTRDVNPADIQSQEIIAGCLEQGMGYGEQWMQEGEEGKSRWTHTGYGMMNNVIRGQKV